MLRIFSSIDIPILDSPTPTHHHHQHYQHIYLQLLTPLFKPNLIHCPQRDILIVRPTGWRLWAINLYMFMLP